LRRGARRDAVTALPHFTPSRAQLASDQKKVTPKIISFDFASSASLNSSLF